MMERFQDLPAQLREVDIPWDWWTQLIPKMHLLGHTQKCHIPYLLNYAPRAAQMCGEAIERMWAMMNGIAPSTREMGVGFCSDTINSHMAHHNWLKHIKMGKFVALCAWRTGANIF
jgi:hypothetical protein